MSSRRRSLRLAIGRLPNTRRSSRLYTAARPGALFLPGVEEAAGDVVPGLVEDVPGELNWVGRILFPSTAATTLATGPGLRSVCGARMGCNPTSSRLLS